MSVVSITFPLTSTGEWHQLQVLNVGFNYFLINRTALNILTMSTHAAVWLRNDSYGLKESLIHLFINKAKLVLLHACDWWCLHSHHSNLSDFIQTSVKRCAVMTVLLSWQHNSNILNGFVVLQDIQSSLTKAYLLPLYNIKLHSLSIPNTAKIFPWVVFLDGRLDKKVIAMRKHGTQSVLYVSVVK